MDAPSQRSPSIEDSKNVVMPLTAPPIVTPRKKKSSTADLLALFNARPSPTSVTTIDRLAKQQNETSSFSQDSGYVTAHATPTAAVVDLTENSDHESDNSDVQIIERPTRVLPKRASPVNYARPQRISKSTPGHSHKKILVSNVATADTRPETVRSRLRLDISVTTKIKRDAFLAEHQVDFLALLPPTNYFTKLAQPASTTSVPFRQLTSQPAKVMATMKPYQLSGLSFLVYMYENGMSAVLGDEMGLGKTLQTLSLFEYLQEHHPVTSGEPRPCLVICPLSVLSSWVAEAKKWTPHLKVLRFHGPSSLRQVLKLQATGKIDRFGNDSHPSEDGGVPDVIITTYEAFVAEQSWFKTAFVWRYCVLDEGHKIKNSATDVSHALQSLKAEYRLLLTGTPIQNNLAEMWSLLHWLLPEVFTDKTSDLFKSAFDLAKGLVSTDFMSNARNLLEILMLRRMKSSPGVNLGLPPKEEVLLYVPLTEIQRHWYTEFLTKMGEHALNEVFQDAQDKEKQLVVSQAQDNELAKPADSKYRRLMNLVMQLRQICIHPYMITATIPSSHALDDRIRTASGKFMVLDRLVTEIVYTREEKLIIFSNFTGTLDWCEDLLNIHGRTPVPYLRLDGSTAMAKRNLAIRLFNDPRTKFKVMLISTRAGGLGLNLPAANNVIFMDFDWNPQVDLQAEARSHRIGQTRPVTVYKICTQGTVEEQMLSRIRKKLYLSTKITDSMKDIYAHGATSKKRKHQAEEDDDESVPQMDTSQLMSLIRRGATTLSHPQLDASQMEQWTYNTIIEKFRDRPTSTGEVILDPGKEEQEWLSTMERIQSTVLEGVQYQRTKKKEVAQPLILDRAARRVGKNTTVEINGHTVSKESMNCKDWEAVPTMAGKDPRLADLKRQKKAPIKHQAHCQVCHSTGHDSLTECVGCPRAYHIECVAPEFQAKVGGRLASFYCPQHQCFDCERKTTEAGGMIYRCRGCEKGYCEDCLDWDEANILGETLDEYEALGFVSNAAWYIDCPSCAKKAGNMAEKAEKMMEKGIESYLKDEKDKKVTTLSVVEPSYIGFVHPVGMNDDGF